MGLETQTQALAAGGWQGANFAFWIITAVVILSAAVAGLSRSVVRAAFALFFTLLGIAGYYVLLGSGFLAVTQVVIYVGGILVLLMFGVLLTNRPLMPDKKDSPIYFVAGGGLGLILLVLINFLILKTPWATVAVTKEPASEVRALGHLLVSQYLLPFEVAGMTLLLCLIGAAYLVRRRER